MSFVDPSLFTTRPEIQGTFGIVGSTHWIATAVGMGMLERGGNAFDAGVATAFALRVVEPHLNGPGADVAIIVHHAKRGARPGSIESGRKPARHAGLCSGTMTGTMIMTMPARDFRGYGPTPPNPHWPGDARIAININLNFEAGGERSMLEGDGTSENMLTDTGFPAYPGKRSQIVESAFEYGPRVGNWRVLRILKEFDVKVSVLGVVRALQQNPEALEAFVAQGHEIVSHGWRWIDYQSLDEATEREHIRLAMEGIKALTGAAPVGWMTGRPSENTRRLLVEHGGLLYDRDSLSDELPYWVTVEGRPHLVIPYSYETNDNRYDHNGWGTAEDFARYMIDCFDLLYAEGAESPKLMSIGLHDRLVGRPGRAVGLIRFLEHVRQHDRVWFATGADIARHWAAHHPAPLAG